MRVWRPQRAFVMGVGQIGLLTALVLRLRGIEVYSFARSKPGTLNSQIVEGIEAKYVSTSETTAEQFVKQVGKADLIVDATGNSSVAFDAMRALGHNGVLVWTSITGADRKHEVSSDKINIDWVLGNKLLLGSVNANREHFEMGIRDLALGEMMFPGVIQRILTNPVNGLDNYKEMMRLLVEEKSNLKVYMNVADE
jgi:threonine dehydrogenase-like Zn-dependent dehydrogenase